MANPFVVAVMAALRGKQPLPRDPQSDPQGDTQSDGKTGETKQPARADESAKPR